MTAVRRNTENFLTGTVRSSRPWLQRLCTLGLALLLGSGPLTAPVLAQAPASRYSPVDPLPPDTGTAGLKQMLVRLQTTARLMQTVAHPDDEDGGMLTLESRGKGVTT